MTKTIMVVDDDEAIVTLVQRVLEGAERYRIITATNGERALHLARRERPDLILLDALMPKMDGYSVCAGLKSDPNIAHIKVVMLTALAQESDRRKAFEAGVDDYLSKPFSIGDLLGKVEKLVSQ